MRQGLGNQSLGKSMCAYGLTWITEQLAAGHAPMSYADLDQIREQGIECIVNLCGEYCDLHTIEGCSGFQVYYLPVDDECAPEMPALEKALEWVEQQQVLGRKVLVHCRFGIGRTGTFILAFLLRQGISLKNGEKLLRKSKVAAFPSRHCQWKLLKKYSRKLKA